KFFATPESRVNDPGPMITPLADVPNWPGAGAPKAERSNQLYTDRWLSGRLGSCTRFGRMVTLGTAPLVCRVLVGSGPCHIGVRKKPVLLVAATITCHPPKARLAARPRDRKFLPCPKGSS